MPISKGEAWGEAGPLPDGGVIARTNAEVRSIVDEARRTGRPIPPIGVLGGDLARALGGRGDESRLHSDSAMRLPLDLGSVLIDGRQFWFATHLVARRSWWRGRLVAVMNVDWLGAWNVAPRAHPNDGRLDLVDADLSVTDRLRARRRLATGTHVPHPDIRTERTRATQLAFDPPLDVWLDGEPMGRAERLSVRVEPDAFTVVV